ncbi:unnamed protein product [Ectocarpus sp. 12 AP-2014]
MTRVNVHPTIRIAILDDEETSRNQIVYVLSQQQRDDEQQGQPALLLHFDTFSSARSFKRGIKTRNYDIVILDWELPESSGIEVLTWVKSYFDSPPAAIIVTNRNAEDDVVTALQHGADDFVSKPFRPKELSARVLAICRRQQSFMGGIAPQDTLLIQGDLSIDISQKQITLKDERVKLTDQEYRLALILLNNIDRPLTRSYLLEHVWGQENNPFSRTLDVHIYRVRRKLGLTAEHGWQLSSVYGYGYQLRQVPAGCLLG